MITAVAESGTGLAPEGVHFTGETFDHVVEGAGFTVPFLDEDVPFFTDRNHEYNGYDAIHTIASMNLVGAEYVMMANDNRGVGDYQLITTVGQAVDAYVFMDTRVAQPAWLPDGGWSYLGSHQMGIDEGGDGVGPGDDVDRRFWLWKKAIPAAGDFVTRERGGTGNNMYGLAVVAPGTGPDYAPFSGQDWTPAAFGLIDIGAADGRGEPGALQDDGGLTQIGGGNSGQNGLNMAARQMTSDQGDTFTIAIDNLDETGAAVGRALDWRDRGDSYLADPPANLPLIKLGEDFVKNNAGIIRVVLGDLAAGQYDVTSFHVDPENDQCDAIRILVDVGDGNGYVDTGVVGDASVKLGSVGNLTPQFVIDNGVTFSFTADGVNDVMILFDGRAADDTEVPLTGLNLTPEPATLALLAFGGLALIRRRRK